MARSPNSPDTANPLDGTGSVGVGDSRSFIKDPYRTESPSTTDATAGRIRTASSSGIQSDRSKWFSRPTKGS